MTMFHGKIQYTWPFSIAFCMLTRPGTWFSKFGFCWMDVESHELDLNWIDVCSPKKTGKFIGFDPSPRWYVPGTSQWFHPAPSNPWVPGCPYSAWLTIVAAHIIGLPSKSNSQKCAGEDPILSEPLNIPLSHLIILLVVGWNGFLL